MQNLKQLSGDRFILDHDASAMTVNEQPLVFDVPLELGTCDAALLSTSHQIVLGRSQFQFHPGNTGPTFSFGTITRHFQADTFVVSSSVGGVCQSIYADIGKTVTFGNRLTYFTRERETVYEAVVDASRDLRLANLSIPISSLALLVGEDITDRLLKILNLSETHSGAVHRIPLRITQILYDAVNPRVSGSMWQLYVQSKVLEYLCELVDLVEKREYEMVRLSNKQALIRSIHDELLDWEGKLPSLAELSQAYDLPARTLNQLFMEEFGRTIQQCVTRSRLEKAHRDIQASDVPLKELAHQLGYSHVNHFITAFKREFGYPPGSLRHSEL